MEDAAAVSSGVVLAAAAGELGAAVAADAERPRDVCISGDGDHVAPGDCGGSSL